MNVHRAAKLLLRVGASASSHVRERFTVRNLDVSYRLTGDQEAAVEHFLEEGPAAMLALYAEIDTVRAALDAADSRADGTLQNQTAPLAQRVRWLRQAQDVAVGAGGDLVLYEMERMQRGTTDDTERRYLNGLRKHLAAYLEREISTTERALVERADAIALLDAAGLSDGDGLAAGIATLATEREDWAQRAARLNVDRTIAIADFREAHTALDDAGAEPGAHVATRIRQRFGAYTVKAGAEAEELRRRMEDHTDGPIADEMQLILAEVDARDSLRWLEELDAVKAKLADSLQREAAAQVYITSGIDCAARLRESKRELRARVAEIEADRNRLHAALTTLCTANGTESYEASEAMWAAARTALEATPVRAPDVHPPYVYESGEQLGVAACDTGGAYEDDGAPDAAGETGGAQ